MNDAKYSGRDVHQATISATVLDSTGKLVMESILEAKAETILQFVCGLRGSLHVTFEEGTCATWLHDLLKPRIAQVLVCDPRKNALLKVGNKNDRIDSRKLAELLRGYMTITKDLTHVMVRLKTISRSWAIPCAGQQVYAPRHRAAWLVKITEAGVRRQAEMYYQQLDALLLLHQQVRRELLAESRKHDATKLLRQVPSIGPIRAALLLALLQTSHRFRTMKLTSSRFSTIFLCPLVKRSQTRLRSAALSAPSTMRPLMSTIVTPPTCRVFAVKCIGNLLGHFNSPRLYDAILIVCRELCAIPGESLSPRRS
jgi:hypothetical protein